MSWENPPVPHEVNVSRESVLAEFLRLLAGLSICVLARAFSTACRTCEGDTGLIR